MFKRSSAFAGPMLAFALAAAGRSQAQVCSGLEYGLEAQPVGSEPWCAAAGDVDGDGLDDLWVGRSPLFGRGSLGLLRSAGPAGFVPVEIVPGVSSTRSLAVGDLDLDGDLDLVVADLGVYGTNEYLNDGLSVFANDGQGHFAALPMTLFDPLDDEPQTARLADLDLDGDLDVVLAVRHHRTGPLTAEGRVIVYVNDGQAGLVRLGDYPAGGKPRNLEVADFDGDQRLDYATLVDNSAIYVVLGNGDGTFQGAGASYAVGQYPSGLAAGDFDGDLDVDLAAGFKYGLRVMRNQGNGAFVAGPMLAFSSYNKGLAAGDFDLDGRLDLVATFAGAAAVQFLAGDGAGGFSVYRSYPAGSQAYALTLGDWDGDRVLDAATADFGGADVLILTSQCASQTYCTAKANSQGCVPSIGATGSASAGAGSGFLVTATNVLGQKTGMVIYGTSGRTAVPFGGGTLCVAAPLRRTPAQNSGGSASGADCTGQYAFDFNAWIAIGFDPALVPGAVVDAQYWSRDPGFAPPDNIGLTDALEFAIAP
jgi:hypothetical protein